LCDDQDQTDRLLKIASGPASGVYLVEHAAWSSLQKIYTRSVELVTDRDVLTYDAFVAMFGDAVLTAE
jgi:hypothetical protein